MNAVARAAFQTHPGCRPRRRRLSVPGLLGREDASAGARSRRQEGRALVGDPPNAAAEEGCGRPIKYLFLENVDRLIKSPSGQRGRDFAVMLASLADLGYEVEWRVVNAADYGFPQKRRRVFIVGRLDGQRAALRRARPDGRACTERCDTSSRNRSTGRRSRSTVTSKVVSDTFNIGPKRTPSGNAGVMRDQCRRSACRRVDRRDVRPSMGRASRPRLSDVLEPTADVPAQFFVEGDDLEKWRFLKGKKSLTTDQSRDRPRVHVRRGADPVP